jgi:hypothetical protein
MPPAAVLFIANKIIEQAAREGVALSEVERKMLLFSESSPTFRQMNEIFDRTITELSTRQRSSA